MYARKGGRLYFCTDRATHEFGFLSSTDQSDDKVVCRRVDDLADVAKLAYYAIKLLKVLGPPPP